MSYPYPQDRHRHRKEDGKQPYRDAKEAMSENTARIQSEAEAFGEEHQDESEEDRKARLASEMQERLAEDGDEVGERPSDRSNAESD